MRSSATSGVNKVAARKEKVVDQVRQTFSSFYILCKKILFFDLGALAGSFIAGINPPLAPVC